MSCTGPQRKISGWNIGTPNQVISTMARCWTVEPSSDRIVEDITGLQRVMDIIVEKLGCSVLDEFLRSGRRYEKISAGGRECKNKPRAMQRISTQAGRSLHPDAILAKSMLFSDKEIDAADDAAILDLVDPDAEELAEEEDSDDEVEEEKDEEAEAGQSTNRLNMEAESSSSA